MYEAFGELGKADQLVLLKAITS